jgi:5-methyltetrahydrofolate--homocysteine methyltransferase
MSDILREISEQLYAGEVEQVADLVEKALSQGIAADNVLLDGLMLGMERVGKDFKCGDLYVPEVIVSAKAMHTGMALLKPFLGDSTKTQAGKFVIGTVKGDLHDIGKSLVKLMLEGSGFVGVDLGTDVSTEQFVAAVREHKPDVLAMSALLTTTMVNMQTTIEALKEAGLRDLVNVIVGGAPVTYNYAKDIGADGYAPDAARAVDITRQLVSPA